MGQSPPRPPPPVADALPSGVVTFLFSDIEGSTRLFQRLGERYVELLEDHRRLLESAFSANGGYVVDTSGDGLFVVFADPRAALDAALTAQLAISAHGWPRGTQVRVRMGIHSGEATPEGGTYVALAVHQAARIAAAAHGGQVLVSDDTCALSQDHPAPGVVLSDLGLHRLKDFDHPQRLFQLVHPRLARTFPAIRTASGSACNLPVSRSVFIGRDRELGLLTEMVLRAGLTTVTGAAGAGKTRLAVEVARRVQDTYPDGVWLVELGPVSDSRLVLPTVAARLGVPDQPGRHLLDVLVEQVAAKRILVVLDNCEHLVDAAAEVADRLLGASGSVRILATSREPLRLEGEKVCRLGALTLPPEHEQPLEVVAEAEAVRLFCERAGRQGPFELTLANAATVAQLTRRLDGIPLALELAASLVPALEPAQILEHLDDRFELLVGGYRSAPPRQQALWTAVEWGYDLLHEAEQQLFRRLGVFAGTFSAGSVGEVCDDDGVGQAAVLRLLQALVARSMVEVNRQTRGGHRYRLLETLRDFAVVSLERGGEEPTMRDRHFRWVLGLAAEFDGKCDTPAEQVWVDRLAAEGDSLRQALHWGLRTRPAEALRLAGHLGNWWARRSELTEGRQWLTDALHAAPEAPLELQAIALRRLGVLALLQDDQDAARSFLHRAAHAYRRTGDTASLGHILGYLSVVAYEQGDLSGARHIVEESLAVMGAVGDERGVIRSRARLGIIAAMQGRFEEARALLEDAVVAHTTVGDAARTATSLSNLGFVRLLQGDVEGARPVLEQALAMQRQLDRKLDVAQTLISLGELELMVPNGDSAGARFREAAALAQECDAPHAAAEVALGLAAVAVRGGAAATAEQHLAEAERLGRGRGLIVPMILERRAEVAITLADEERAAELLGAACARRKEAGIPLPPVALARHESNLALLRARLGPRAMAAAWDRGERHATAKVVDPVNGIPLAPPVRPAL